MEWFAQAPSNIALIKYMGKKDSSKNIPLNPSLSFTLKNLLSSVWLKTHSGQHDVWEPLNTPGSAPFELSKTAQTRYLNHLAWLKQQYGFKGSLIVRSSNNIPHSSGLASSASSFAALTKCAALAFSELLGEPPRCTEDVAALSRQGSGSSCRSFFAPWALWDDEKVSAIDLPYNDLIHQAIIISHKEKKISSSQAHQKIQTSPMYATREEQARNHLKTLLIALNAQNWHDAYMVCWQEFQDMHRLFTTAIPPFSYKNELCDAVLKKIQDLWLRVGDGPIVTMDAGPNIHLLYRPDQVELANQFKQEHLIGQYDVL